jgi:methionine aminopeptidase
MKTLSSDTSLKAEQMQIKLIRKSSIYKRLLAVNSLVQTTRWLSWRAISERYPGQTEQFLVERYLSLLYDDESLTRRVAHHLFGKA